MALGALDIEYKVDSKKELLSETDLRGVMTYVNDNFVELSGYKESDLIGSPHSLLRHEHMPKTVFKLLWTALQAGKDYKAIIQNKRRTGEYYWVYSEYIVLFDKNKNIRGYRSKRYPVPKNTLDEVEHLYKKLQSIESESSVTDAEAFLNLKLHNDGYLDYSEFIEKLYNTKLKGLFGFFGKLFR